MIEFKLVNKNLYTDKIKKSNKYSELIKELENIDNENAVLLEADKTKISSIMTSISHYFGRGVYSYKTIEGDKRIIFKKNNR